MVANKELIEKLKELNLNSYEAKLWIALLSRGVSTAGELSDIANVPRSRTYDVLESLEKKGFIIIKLGKPIKYLAVPPEEVVVRVKKKVQLDAKYQSDQLEKLKKSSIISNLGQLYSQGIEMLDPTDYTGILKGRTNIYNHLNFMIKNAKKSIVLSGTENSIIEKSKNLQTSLKSAKKKGVDIKIITKITKNNQEYVETLKKVASVKHSKHANSRFMIIDGKEMAFMLQRDDVHPSFDSGIWVKAPHFSQAFNNMFEEIWQGIKKK